MKVLKVLGKPELTILTIFEIICACVTVVIIVSKIDTGGDAPGIIRFIWFVLNGFLWAAAFGIIVIVSMVKNKSWGFLFITIILVLTRIMFLWVKETYGGGAEDHVYIWFPIEGILYFLWKYSVSLKQRTSFMIINLGLYAIQFVLCQ